MQTRKFFREYSHGDLTAKVLSLETFVLYGTVESKKTTYRSYVCENLEVVPIVRFNSIQVLMCSHLKPGTTYISTVHM